MISKRHAKANNPNVVGYDPNKESNYIMYLDANNLYGWAISQPLAYGGFRWMKNGENRRKYKGYMLEVNLE